MRQMAREKLGYRDTIELMTAAGLGYLVPQDELAKFLGCSRITVYRRYPELRGRFPAPKPEVARVICS